MPELDDLDRFDQGLPPMNRLPAAEVRRRGDRMRHRRTALTTGAAALAVAVAVGAPVLALTQGDGRNDVQPAPSPSRTVSPSADPSPGPVVDQAWVTEIPAGFPIAPAADGWDVGSGDQVLAAFTTCDQPGWVPGDADDTLGAVLAGGESSVERTLALYPTDTAASDIVERLADGVRDCPDFGTGQTDYVQPIEMQAEAGEEVVAYVDQYGDAAGPTGEGNAVVVTRVGNALLLQRTYFGGAGDLAVDQRTVNQVVDDGGPIVDAMCVFAAEPCISDADPTGGSAPDPSSSDIPADFPLGTGLTPDADVTVEGPSAEVDGVHFEDLCGTGAWPGNGATDRLAVRATGPEYSETRELVTYTKADYAVAAMGDLSRALDACPTNPATDGNADDDRVFTRLDADTGHESSLTFAMTYRTGLGGGIWQVVRVGRSVLATVETGEYAPETVADGVASLTADNVPITDAMCVWTDAGC